MGTAGLPALHLNGCAASVTMAPLLTRWPGRGDCRTIVGRQNDEPAEKEWWKLAQPGAVQPRVRNLEVRARRAWHHELGRGRTSETQVSRYRAECGETWIAVLKAGVGDIGRGRVDDKRQDRSGGHASSGGIGASLATK